MIDPRWLQYPRIAIAGGPRTGKSTLASLFNDRKIVRTDDYMDTIPWGDIPEIIAAECAKYETFVLEGVQVGRCLRRGLKVDLALWLDRPYLPLTLRQHSMTKGLRGIFTEFAIYKAHGTVVEYV
jgi:hypothetical protein